MSQELVGYGYAGDEELIGDDDYMGDEIIGDDDYMGDDFESGSAEDLLAAAAGYEALVGARHRRGGRGMVSRQAAMAAIKKAAQGALNRRPARGQFRVEQKPPTHARVWPLPLDSGIAIPAGTTFNVQTQPQVIFRCDRLVVPSDFGNVFLINDIKVGKDSQLPAPGSLLARIFAENGFGVSLRGDTAKPGILISISVTNISGGAQRFLGAIIGGAVD